MARGVELRPCMPRLFRAYAFRGVAGARTATANPARTGSIVMIASVASFGVLVSSAVPAAAGFIHAVMAGCQVEFPAHPDTKEIASEFWVS